MKQVLLLIVTLGILTNVYSVSLKTGNLYLDGTSLSKTICYGTESGVITYTGWSVNPDWGQVISQTEVSFDRWEMSYDNSNFGTFSMPSDLNVKNNKQTIYLRKHIKVFGTFYTGLGLGMAYSKEGYSNTITITVLPEVSKGTIASIQTICYNTKPSLINNTSLATGADNVFIYHWENSLDNSSWSIIPSSNALNYEPPVLTQTTYYRRGATSICGTVYTDGVTINVNNNLNVGNISSSQTVCYASTPASISASSYSGGTGSYVLQWQSSLDNSTWSSIPGATGYTYSPPALTQTTYYRLQVTSGTCGTAYSNIIVITVYNKLDPGVISTNQTIPYNTSPSKLSGTSPSGGTGSYSYQWQFSSDNQNWNSIPYATSADYTPSALTQSTYYRRITSNGNCGSVNSNSVKIDVLGSLIAGTISENQTICYNTAPAKLFSSAATGGTGSFIYKWQSSTNSTSWSDIPLTNSLSYQPPALTQTTYYRIGVTSDNCGTSYSTPVVIIVHNNLVSGSIGSNQTICYNNTPVPLTASSPTGGTGAYTYQWQSSINNSIFSNIPDASSSNYFPPALTRTTYFKLATTSENCGTVYSNTVTIPVYDLFTSGQIADNQTIYYNTVPNTLNGIVSPTGGTGNYSYQWQYQTSGGTFTNIPNSTNNSYSPPALTQTTYYRRSVTSGSCGTIYSDPITITVYDDLNPGVISSNQILCYGFTPNVLTGDLPTGGSGTYNYQWEVSENDVDWSALASGKNQNYAPGALTSSKYYRRAVTSPPDTRVKYTNEIVITVLPQLVEGIVGNDQTICFNTAPISLAGSNPTGGTGSYNYQWYSSSDKVNWNPIALATGTIYSPPVLTQSKYYHRAVTSGNCGTDVSNVVTIQILPALTAGNVTPDEDIYYNTQPSSLVSEEATGGTGSYVYKWQKSETGAIFNDIALASNKTYSPSKLIKTTHYRLSISSGACGTIYSSVIDINVYPELKPGTVTTENQTICYNTFPSPFTASASSGSNGSYAYQWEFSEDGANWSPITLGKSQNYVPPALTKTTYYRRTVTTPPDARIKYTNEIVVNVLPQINPGTLFNSQSLCYNTYPKTLYGEDPTGGMGDYTFKWYKSKDSIQWDVEENTNSIYSPPALTQTTYYRRIVTSGACGSVNSNAIKISVFDNLVPGTVTDNQTICYNSSPSILTGPYSTGAAGTYNYQWQYANGNISWTNIPNATQYQYQPQVLIQTTYYRRATTSGACNVMYSNPVTISVNSILSAGTISKNQVICYNASPTMFAGTLPTGGTGNFTYTWQKSENASTWTDIFMSNEKDLSESSPLTKSCYYKRTVTSENCGSAESNLVRIKVLQELTSPAVPLNNSYCPGSQVTLDVSNRDSTYDYVWNLEDEDEYLDNLTVLNLRNSLVFNVRASYKGLCESQKTNLSIKLDSVVSNFKTDYVIGKIGTPVQFENLSKNATSYQWDMNNEGSSTDSNPWFYFYSPGDKTITLIAKSNNGCADTIVKQACIKIQDAENNVEKTENGNFYVYPNPVLDKLYVKIPKPTGEISYQIINEKGTVIKTNIIKGINEPIAIDFSDYPAGLYLLKIKLSNQLINKKIQKL